MENSLLRSPLHQAECIQIVDDIIDNLDDSAILELMSGSGNDIDSVIDSMVQDAYNVLYTGNIDADFSPKYTQRVSDCLEEYLRNESLTYFITSVLPDFQLSWHHLEWGDLVQRYHKLCINAARDHGKCFARGTQVRMKNGHVKNIEDIRVGDIVMGADLKARRVLSIHNGEDEMYEITRDDKVSFVVNSRHIQTFLNVEDNTPKIVDLPITYFFDKPHSWIYRNYRLINVNYKSRGDKTLCEDIPIDKLHHFVIKPAGRGEYFGFTCDEDERFLLADGTVTHNSYYFSNAYAIWRLYTFSKINKQFSRRPTTAKSNRGYLFSFSLQQSVDLMEILKGTIESNDILKQRLMPDSVRDGAWASTNIVCKNGARLTCKGFGSSVRGAHPYWIVVDDGLKDNVIYSKLQRQKSIDYFHSVIMNMLVPDGWIVVVGTPFHSEDLYGDLKKKDITHSTKKRGWMVIEYPAIFPDGRILWPQRWSFQDLMEKRSTQGNIIFSRENLCRPITSESSIFPLKTLERCLVGMENYTLVKNRGDFPIKFPTVVVGCDFAISSNVGVDYFVFTVWGVTSDREMYLMNMYRGRGKTFHEQMQILRAINLRFSPDCMVLEQNVFQQIFVQESDKQGMPVVGHTTGVEKNDLKRGWPAVAILMERGKIHIPIGDQESVNAKDLIFDDLGSVAFTDKGLESVGSHDDISSSIWLATLGANKISTGFKFSFF